MSVTVKNISVIYSPINQNNTFSSGDFISGHVILDLAKDTKMQSLSVKIKGKAEVCWRERHKSTVVYSDKEKYYSVERFFVRENKTHGNDHEMMLRDPSGQPYSSVVGPGRHIYPFTLQLPRQYVSLTARSFLALHRVLTTCNAMQRHAIKEERKAWTSWMTWGHFPPTFKASVGKIVYTLETKLSRSMRISSKAKAEFLYFPSPDVFNPELMAPQCRTKDEQMNLFSFGSVSMNIKTEKMGYHLGEGLKVLAEVQNNSSRTIKPKYCLYEKHSFFARGKRKLHTHDLFKEEGEPIEPNSRKTVTKVLPIPPSLTVSILNCRILKVEYRLRVCLDVPFASEIKFPVVILPLQSLSGVSSATNSNFGIWNQPPGGNAYPNPPPMPPSAPPFNMVEPPAHCGALGYPGPPLSQYSAPGYPGPPLSQFPAPGYPGPPGQFAPPSYAGLPGQFGPSVSHQSDSSAPPPYQECHLYPQLPDHPEKS